MRDPGGYPPTRPASALLPIGLSILLAGCGGSSTQATGPDEARRVSDVVDAFNDARLSTKQSEKLFAKGAMPDKSKFGKYAQYSYWANAGRPQINGDSATLKISVRDEKTSDGAGQVEWSFKKERDGWKIATAPLP